MSSVAVGDVIPLVFNSGDANENLFVRAFVKDSGGSSIAGSPFSLSWDGESYVNNSVEMQDKDYLKADYIAYVDALFTKKANYLEVSDVFTRAGESSFQEIDGELTATIKSRKLTSVISSTSLVASASSNKLTSVIKSNSVSASFNTNNLNAIIKTNKLIATAKEC